MAIDQLIAGVELQVGVAWLVGEDHPAVFPSAAVARRQVDPAATPDGFAAGQVERAQEGIGGVRKLLVSRIAAQAGNTGRQQHADHGKYDQQFRQGEAGGTHRVWFHRHASGAAVGERPAMVRSPRLLSVSVPHWVSMNPPAGVADSTMHSCKVPPLHSPAEMR